MRKPITRYVIITPTYNEGGFIRETIEGVTNQTIVPIKWVIVDDGSTDSTAEIVKQYEKGYEFIEYCKRVREADQSYYESNVCAILEGYERVKKLNFEYLAILDADMKLCKNYYQEIFKRFEANESLGIATGTYIEEIGGSLKEALIDRRSTPKALQVFKRNCYEQIGGYIPFRYGGEDAGAEILARMHGWKTWSFPEIRAFHQRPVGTGDGRSLLQGRYILGFREYSLGTHPVFMVAKCLRRCFVEYPYFTSGLTRFLGFICGYFSGEKRQLPRNAIRFLRQEQWSRLLRCVGLGPSMWRPVNSSPEENEVGQ